MALHLVKCPHCNSTHGYNSNIGKPKDDESSVCGYTWENPKLVCHGCGYQFSLQIKVSVETWTTREQDISNEPLKRLRRNQQQEDMDRLLGKKE